MGLQIEDATGGGNGLKVTEENMGRVYAVVESEISHESEHSGGAYSWTAISADLAAGVGGIHLTNESTTEKLIIEKIYVWGRCSNTV